MALVGIGLIGSSVARIAMERKDIAAEVGGRPVNLRVNDISLGGVSLVLLVSAAVTIALLLLLGLIRF